MRLVFTLKIVLDVHSCPKWIISKKLQFIRVLFLLLFFDSIVTHVWKRRQLIIRYALSFFNGANIAWSGRSRWLALTRFRVRAQFEVVVLLKLTVLVKMFCTSDNSIWVLSTLHLLEAKNHRWRRLRFYRPCKTKQKRAKFQVIHTCRDLWSNGVNILVVAGKMCSQCMRTFSACVPWRILATLISLGRPSNRYYDATGAKSVPQYLGKLKGTDEVTFSCDLNHHLQLGKYLTRAWHKTVVLFIYEPGIFDSLFEK